MDDVYNYNDIDKLYMIYKDLDKYMKHLKKDIGIIKQNFKTISANQTDPHQTLMKFLNYNNNNNNNNNNKIHYICNKMR